jgi:transposase-like protein
VLDLLRERYFDFNLAHFREKLGAEHGVEIKRETLRRWAGAYGLIKRARARKRRPRAYKTRARLPRAGMLLQMDGSTHRWFGKNGMSSCLIGAIDDASSVCTHAELFPAEDTLSVLSVLKSIVQKVGVPEVLYVDQAGHFGKRYNRMIHLNWQEHLTQVERAMQELGCRVLFASSPQAKGRIERMWHTFQDRLIPELRVAGIDRIPSANTYLKDRFVPEFNQRFAIKPAQKKTAFKPVPKIWADRLDWVFSIREFRKVSLGETVSWNGRTYLVCNNYGLTLKRHTIEIRTHLQGETQAFFAGRTISLTDIGSTESLNLKAV